MRRDGTFWSSRKALTNQPSSSVDCRSRLIRALKGGLDSESRSRANTDLVKDVMHMHLHSGLADEEKLSDLKIGKSMPEQFVDFALTTRKACLRIVIG